MSYRIKRISEDTTKDLKSAGILKKNGNLIYPSQACLLLWNLRKEVVNNLKILNPSKGRANTCCTIQLKESLEFFIPGGHFTFKDQWKKIPKSKRRKLTWHKSSEFRLILNIMESAMENIDFWELFMRGYTLVNTGAWRHVNSSIFLVHFG